jgi:phage/plasmid-like protein (TIGR03299 family)
MPAEVESMMYVGEPPWHGLGVRVHEAPDSERALVLAGLDWAVESRPVYDANGNPIEGYRANVRATDNKVLGVVGSRYRVVQNREAFAFADALLGEGVTFETAGSLYDGKRVWLMARLQEPYDLAGDETTVYLVVVNSHDGSTPVRLVVSPVRVVCANTLNMAIQHAYRTYSIRHTGDFMVYASQAREALGLAREYLDRLNGEAERMLRETWSRRDWDQLVTALFPLPDEASDRQIATVQAKREFLHRQLMAADLDNIRWTRWGALQAVAAYTSHAGPMRETATWRDARMARFLDGYPLLQRAYDILTEGI